MGLTLNLRLSEISSISLAASRALLNLAPYSEFRFYTEADGTVKIANKGTLDDPIVYSSNHVYLDSATMSVPLPVISQLGTEDYAGTAISQGTTTLTPITGGYNVSDPLSSSSAGMVINLSTTRASSTNMLLSFNAVINSGAASIRSYYDGATFITFPIPIPIINGLNEIEIPSRAGTATVFFRFSTGETFDFDMTEISEKEITTTDSYAHYYDVATKSIVSMDMSSTPSRTYSLTDSFSQWFTTDIPLTDAMRSYIETYPWCIADLVVGTRTHPGLPLSASNIVNYVPGNEGVAGAEKLYDATDGTGATYYSIVGYLSTCRTNYLNITYGLPNVMTVQDASGRLTGMQSGGIISFNGDERYVDTGWVPSGEWILETAFYLDGNSSNYYGSSLSNFRLGESSSGVCRVTMNGSAINTTLTTGSWAFVSMHSNGNVYVNGILRGIIDMTGFSESNSFYFGRVNDGHIAVYTMKEGLNYFKVFNDQSYDAAASYAEYLATLP